MLKIIDSVLRICCKTPKQKIKKILCVCVGFKLYTSSLYLLSHLSLFWSATTQIRSGNLYQEWYNFFLVHMSISWFQFIYIQQKRVVSIHFKEWNPSLDNKRKTFYGIENILSLLQKGWNEHFVNYCMYSKNLFKTVVLFTVYNE